MTRISLKTFQKKNKAAAFIILFFLLAGIGYVIFYDTPLQKEATRFAAKASQAGLAAFGEQTTYSEGAYPQLTSAKFNATINDVCSGGIELIVLFGIIFASIERPMRDRIKGFLMGVVVLVVFNIIRITATLLFLSEFLHSILFRITLILVIVGYYWYWLTVMSKPRARFASSKK